jgi:hypothetical protein
MVSYYFTYDLVRGTQHLDNPHDKKTCKYAKVDKSDICAKKKLVKHLIMNELQISLDKPDIKKKLLYLPTTTSCAIENLCLKPASTL